MNKIIFLIVCVLSVSCSKQDPIPKTVSTPDNEIVPMDHPRKSSRITTVQHDNHWFLVLGDNFIHHISCPCKKALEKE